MLPETVTEGTQSRQGTRNKDVTTAPRFDQEDHILAALELRGGFPEVFFTVDRLAVDLHDHVTRLHLYVVRKRIGFNFRHDHALALRDIQPVRLLTGQGPDCQAELGWGGYRTIGVVFRRFG